MREVTLCAEGLHGSARECADRSHDMLGHDTDVEHVAAYPFNEMETNPAATTREIRRPLRCMALDERATVTARCSDGDLSGPKRAGRV